MLSRNRLRLLLRTMFVGLTLATLPCDLFAGGLRLSPAAIELVGPESTMQVLLSEDSKNGRLIDRTTAAAYEIEDASIVTIDQRGRIEPRSEGTTKLHVTFGSQTVTAAVSVKGIDNPRAVSFRNEVIPALTKSGCNSGGCHGKAEGQNGFRLSIFGFDADADYAALVKESRGRRVLLAAPEKSLLLQKGSGRTPHGGGPAMPADSFGYRRTLRWIEEGARLDDGEASEIVRIEVQPAEQVLSLRNDNADNTGTEQQLRVIAYEANGQTRDVTAETAFETNAPTIAEVDERGLIEGFDVPGEAAILVRYMGHVGVCRIRIPRPNVSFPRPSENNFIDGLVWNKLAAMGIEPSELCTDAEFLRRASLDVIGTLPTAEETRRFLNDPAPDKRSRLVDDLLNRPEYAAYWALRWCDLLKVDANALGATGSVGIHRWLRNQFRDNRPYDEIVRDILTARGHLEAIGPTPFYTTLDKPNELASATSQLFLGVRIECAECHHHPFERWSQADFTAYAGFFTGLKTKSLPDGSKSLIADLGRDLKHPRTGETVLPAGLGQTALESDALPHDRRLALTDWMTNLKNPFFAKSITNRLWAHYFGRGLVEPLDDIRATNPATNEPLLNALAESLIEDDYDLKKFTKTMLASRVYQLSHQTTETNATDQQNFSHAAYRPLPAEVLLDAVCQATDVPEKFNGWPIGARAIEVWDNRMPKYFFRIFGRPQRTTVCACERGDDPTISQALHVMNSPEIGGKVGHRLGRARQLAESQRTPDEIIEELYLATLNREPTPAELRLMRSAFADQTTDRQTAVEDVLWTLLNTKEFLFNH